MTLLAKGKWALGAMLFFLLGAGTVLLYPFKLSPPDTEMEVVHVAYACGECFVQNRIVGAVRDGKLTSQRTFENESYSPLRFLGWDVVVFIKGHEHAISNYVGEVHDTKGCDMPPRFRIKGQFKRKLIYAFLYGGDHYDGVYFDAHEGVAVHPKPCKLGERSL